MPIITTECYDSIFVVYPSFNEQHCNTFLPDGRRAAYYLIAGGRAAGEFKQLSLIRWIRKRNTIQIARIEPPADSLRAARRSLLKTDESVVGWFQAICRNGQNGSDELALILVEDLHDVTV